MNDETKPIEPTPQSAVPTPTALIEPEFEPAPANPLESYFRVPAIQIELPSQGKFYPPGTLNYPEDGLIDVYPMTAKDEMVMKSPEGLLSGSSVSKTIQSCVPAIKDAYQMPGQDVDTILIAIRIASYEHDMEITTTCPHCNEINENNVDLRAVLDSIPKGTIENKVTIQGLDFVLKPYTWKFINENKRASFEQGQLTRQLAGAELSDEEKTAALEKMFMKLANHSVESVAIAIKSITLKNGQTVVDRDQITEFVHNASRNVAKQIRDAITLMATAVEYPPFKSTCEHDGCLKKYDVTVEFNQANFFE